MPWLHGSMSSWMNECPEPVSMMTCMASCPMAAAGAAGLHSTLAATHLASYSILHGVLCHPPSPSTSTSVSGHLVMVAPDGPLSVLLVSVTGGGPSWLPGPNTPPSTPEMATSHCALAIAPLPGLASSPMTLLELVDAGPCSCGHSTQWCLSCQQCQQVMGGWPTGV